MPGSNDSRHPRDKTIPIVPTTQIHEVRRPVHEPSPICPLHARRINSHFFQPLDASAPVIFAARANCSRKQWRRRGAREKAGTCLDAEGRGPQALDVGVRLTTPV